MGRFWGIYRFCAHFVQKMVIFIVYVDEMGEKWGILRVFGVYLGVEWGI